MKHDRLQKQNRITDVIASQSADWRGNLLVRFTSLHSKTNCCTGRFPRQGFALPRNDMVVASQVHHRNC